VYLFFSCLGNESIVPVCLLYEHPFQTGQYIIQLLTRHFIVLK